MDSRQLSVLRTLSYSDVFDYPLSLQELHYFLQTSKPLSLSELRSLLLEMSPLITWKDGFYAFSDKKTAIRERLSGKEIAIKKIAMARKTAHLLMRIPSVLFIGISGAVAGGGAVDSDDIDFFVITSKKTLYTTRFLLLFFLQLMGKRRRRSQVDAPDKICLNMLLDESSLRLANNRQDLYTAREVAQIIPLFERNNMYASFLAANSWTQDILPYAKGKLGCVSIANRLFLVIFISNFEPLLRFIQRYLIRRHKTNEKISNSLLAFHPRDMKKYVLREYTKRLRHYIKCYTIAHSE